MYSHFHRSLLKSNMDLPSLGGPHHRYNNQWMILDVELLLKREAKAGVLWILEQIPGTVEVADETKTLLHQGFWASYNVP